MATVINENTSEHASTQWDHGDHNSEIQMAMEKPMQYSFTELNTLTSHFSIRLGNGSFGEVYKGKLCNGVEVAVKVLKDDKNIRKQFMAEVSTLGIIHHKNLLKLYGYCFEPDKKALVYEYMENGSLDKILYDNNQNIEWEKLYDIAIGIACGISYLHEHCQKKIIHYDLKPSNILLDSRFSPKVGDFGLAKLYNRENSYVQLSGARGTSGYAAPELFIPAQKVTSKCDVYSYGMILFDLLRRGRHRENYSFPGQVWEKLENGQFDQIMDDCDIKEKDRETAKKISTIALWCVQFIPTTRPSMSFVIQLLQSGQGITIPPNPFGDWGSSSIYSNSKIIASSGSSSRQVPSNVVHSSTSERQVQIPSLVPTALVEYDKNAGQSHKISKAEENEKNFPSNEKIENRDDQHWTIRAEEVVHFRCRKKPNEDDFHLELSKNFTYDDVVEKVASHLGLDDPTKVRLISHNCYTQQPKRQPISFRGVDHLSDMLVHDDMTSDILYFEVLNIPWSELQGFKTLKVSFHHTTKDEVVFHRIILPKQSTVGDMIEDLKTKVELSRPNAELRLLEISSHRIFKIFPSNEKIENIDDQHLTIRAEEIPEDENIGPDDWLLRVCHFTKNPAQTWMPIQYFGEPFLLVIRNRETLSDVKVRIQKKLQVGDEEFAKWKFAYFIFGLPLYLQDSEMVTRWIRINGRSFEYEVGLEHSDTTPKRACAANQNRHT